MPMSLLTYVQTSSECPSFSAIEMYSAVLPRIADCSALISGSTGSRSKLSSSSVRLPGTKVYAFLAPVSGAAARRSKCLAIISFCRTWLSSFLAAAAAGACLLMPHSTI